MSKLVESPPPTAAEKPTVGGDGRPPRRALAAVAALLVAAAGLGFAVVAFRTDERPRPTAAAANGKIAFATSVGGRWQIVTVNADGTAMTPLTDLPTDQFHPAWSPDGTRIAFDAQGVSGEMQIDVMDADGSNLQTLTERPGWNYLSAWSPDGARIAFVSNRDGNDEIYVMNADGSGQTRLTDAPGEDLSLSWSPDGTRIAFQSKRDGFNRIYVMNADGSGVIGLADSEGFDPAWSGDGTGIAFVSTKDDNPEIYVMNAEGSNVTRLTHDPSRDWNPSWSPDGTKLAFESDRDGQMDIYVMNADGTDVTRLLDTGAQACCPAWQPVPAGEVSPAPSSTSSPIPTPSPVNPRITATIKVGDFPNAVAVAEGSIWVSVPNNDGTATGQILRIDPATNDIVAAIPIVAIPTWETGGGGLTAGAGSVWVAGSGPAQDLGDEPGGGWEAGLLRIDPDRNEVVATLPLGGESGADVAVTGDAAWVLIFSGSNQMSVLRIDPFTDQIVANIPVPGVWGQEIFATENGVFVNTRDPYPELDSTVGASRLTMIDPITNQVRWTLVDTRFVESFQPDAIWAQGGGTKDANVGGQSLLHLDPDTGQTLGDPIPVDGLGGAFAVAPDGGIWFSGSNQQEWTIGRFNPVVARIDASIGTGNFTHDNGWWPTAVAMDPASDTIWLVHYRDNMTRIDLD